MKKVTISLPDDQADAVERLRLRQGLSRSGLLQEAIRHYLGTDEQREAVHGYVEAYRRNPEPTDARAFAAAAARGMGAEDW